MALAGTSQAQASVLCDDGSSAAPCPSGEQPFEDAIDFELESPLATFTSSSGQVRCNESAGAGAVTDAGATSGTPAGTLNAIDWTNNGSQNCPTTLPLNPTANSEPLMLSWGVEGSWSNDNTSGAANGTVTLTGVHARITVNLLGGIDCDYKGDSQDTGSYANADGKVVGSAYNADNVGPEESVADGEAEVAFVGAPLIGDPNNGLLCPASGKFDAVYELHDSNGGNGLYLRQ